MFPPSSDHIDRVRSKPVDERSYRSQRIKVGNMVLFVPQDHVITHASGGCCDASRAVPTVGALPAAAGVSGAYPVRSGVSGSHPAVSGTSGVSGSSGYVRRIRCPCFRLPTSPRTSVSGGCVEDREVRASLSSLSRIPAEGCASDCWTGSAITTPSAVSETIEVTQHRSSR